MRKIFVIGAALLAVVAGGPAYSQSDKLTPEIAYEAAMAFVECSALFEATSRWVKNDDKDLSESLHNYANGALTAAAMIASSSSPPKQAWEFARNSVEADIPRWSAMLRHEGFAPTAEPHSKQCLEMQDLQRTLVSEARKQVYGFK